MPLGLLQAAQPGLLDVGSAFWPLLLFMVLGWFLLIRPMSKEKKDKEQMRSSLKAGDQVVTIGGMFGTVTRLDDQRVTLRVADGVQLQFARTAIASVLAPPEKE